MALAAASKFNTERDIPDCASHCHSRSAWVTASKRHSIAG